jgi:DNA-binding response OmpR family regulator
MVNVKKIMLIEDDDIDVMPKINGYEVAKKLIENKSKSKIIMLSAKAQKTDIEKGLSIGVNYYITKPFDLIKLSNLIDEIA